MILFLIISLEIVVFVTFFLNKTNHSTARNIYSSFNTSNQVDSESMKLF